MAKKLDITTHSFYQALLQELRPLIPRTRLDIPSDPSKLDQWRKSNQSKLTSSDRYLMQVFTRANNLMHVIERLTKARYLLGRSPSAYRTREIKFNRDTWSEYHFFVYTTSMASVLDCALILTASVFKLGLPPRFCTFDVVTQHNWISGSNLPKSLRLLRKSLEKHTERRHRYLHRGEESDIGEVTDPDAFLYLRAFTLISDSKEPNESTELKLSRPMLRYMWRLQLNELRPKLQQYEADVLAKVSLVLDNLQPKFNQQLHPFSSSTAKRP